MKNVTLIRSVRSGKISWRLLGEGGLPNGAFECFASYLERKHAQNTRKAYSEAVARFFDYLLEGERRLKERKETFSRSAIRDLIEAYPDWLILGKASGNALVRDMHERLPSPELATPSAQSAMAAVKAFLALSERVRQELKEIADSGESDLFIDAAPLWEEIGESRPIKKTESLALKNMTMLGGVLSGGPKLISAWELPAGKLASPDYDQEKAFPFDKAVELVGAFGSWRDKALYAFCAASGCRVHEALQLLWEDIALNKREVRLINPFSRMENASYKALDPSDRDKLAWKGRSSSGTLLLHPFKDIFFACLGRYLQEEYVAHGRHAFVFQYSTKEEYGRPFFLARESGRAQTFAAAREKIIPGAAYGVHSLRHMYGTYLVNYFPNSRGTYGLPLEWVQKLMGHKTIAATQKYARPDAKLIAAEMQAAFAITAEGGAKSIAQIRRDILAANLAAAEDALAKEKAGDS